MERRWWLSPAWVRREYAISDDPRRAEGGGYVSAVTGERIYSPFLVGYYGGALCLFRKPLDYDDEAVYAEWQAWKSAANRALHESLEPDYIDGYVPTPEQRLGSEGLEKSRRRFVDFITERLGPLQPIKVSDAGGERVPSPPGPSC